MYLHNKYNFKCNLWTWGDQGHEHDIVLSVGSVGGMCYN